MTIRRTIISGYTSPKPNPFTGDHTPAGVKGWNDWYAVNHKLSILSGYWQLEKAIEYARKRGIVRAIEIRHETIGSKEWQCGVDCKWVMGTINSKPILMEPTVADNAHLLDVVRKAQEALSL